MIERIDDTWFRTKYLNFRDDGKVSKGSITHKFTVYQRKTNSPLGIVKWWCNWRQYNFFPFNGTMFDKTCQRDIADFLELVTNEQRAKRSRT